MIPAYFVSVVYLIAGAMLFLMDVYRKEFSFMLRFRDFLEKKALWFFFSLGIVDVVLLLVFPIDPGPMVLGDLIPSLFVLFETIYFTIHYSKKWKDRERAYEYSSKAIERKKIAGYVLFAIGIIHFLLPSFILL